MFDSSTFVKAFTLGKSTNNKAFDIMSTSTFVLFEARFIAMG